MPEEFGDSADGFPGLPGWGAKSAAAVLRRYGTIEASDGSRHQEIELESKLILEKHWLDDLLVGTFNFTLEPEWASRKTTP